MQIGISLCIACAVLFLVGRLIKRKYDRLAVMLQVVAAWGVLNFLDTNYPTDSRRFGYGCPLKWQYDPAYRSTPNADQQKAIAPESQWRFDDQALLLDLAIGLGVLVFALVVNEIWQRSQGRRSSPPDFT